VDDPVRVRRVQRVGDLDAEIERLIERERFAHETIFQCLAFDELHHDEVAAGVLVDVVDRADVRVFQCRRRARLASQPLERLRVVADLLREELQRDATAELDVLGLVDDAHAAAAELLQDPVVGDGLADHVVNPQARRSGSA
jgi:hypothetical protein